jgi:hypothetical protein
MGSPAIPDPLYDQLSATTTTAFGGKRKRGGKTGATRKMKPMMGAKSAKKITPRKRIR